MKHCVATVFVFALAALTTAGWTGASWAQAKVARVGILAGPTTDEAILRWYEPFRRALAEHGWIEGKNVSFEYRTARGDSARFAEAAAELVQLKVDVIFADSAPATRAAYAATRTIPIVGLDYTNDPVAAGYAQSYGRPAGNLTGYFLDAPQFAVKWLELLKAVVPGLSRVAVVWDPRPGAIHLQAVQDAAQRFGVRLQVLEVHKPADLEPAFSGVRAQGLIILPSPMTWGQSARLAELAMQHRLPATSFAIPFAEAGGVLAYGPDTAEALERCGILVARILGGAKPGDLPVERPTKFELVVNLKTVRALGLSVPDSVLIGARRVIQ
jgi:putative ABC transport system substrate-binding protein